MKASERFALSQWLTDYPEDASFDEVLDIMRDPENTWCAETVTVWEAVETFPLADVAGFIEDTKHSFERFTYDFERIEE
jgi:hypothetical protein